MGVGDAETEMVVFGIGRHMRVVFEFY
jgi:hypothetical protein